MLSFETMYGVDGPFIGKKNAIRGVVGDELPWQVASAVGSLTTDGHLHIDMTGLVFTNDPEVPPELRGIHDEEEFRGLVSCITPDHKKGKKTITVNVVTQGFAATSTGNATIDAHVELPEDCIAPVIFVMSGSEDKWFAVTGAETD